MDPKYLLSSVKYLFFPFSFVKYPHLHVAFLGSVVGVVSGSVNKKKNKGQKARAR